MQRKCAYRCQIEKPPLDFLQEDYCDALVRDAVKYGACLTTILVPSGTRVYRSMSLFTRKQPDETAEPMVCGGWCRATGKPFHQCKAHARPSGYRGRRP